ncbi:hypothetical protein SAZ11_51115 [Streptomyces sp. FXJ1.4098]|nr:hypothetical protein [Streptomyces sp. FXJ1.4098]
MLSSTLASRERSYVTPAAHSSISPSSGGSSRTSRSSAAAGPEAVSSTRVRSSAADSRSSSATSGAPGKVRIAPVSSATPVRTVSVSSAKRTMRVIGRPLRS